MQGYEDRPPGGPLPRHTEVPPLAGQKVLALVPAIADKPDLVTVNLSPRQRGEVRTGSVTLTPGDGGGGGGHQESRGLGHLLERREGEVTE